MSSASAEHYTPPAIIRAVLAFWGQIDLDPCSNSREFPNVPARTVYTIDDDGLARPWFGRVFLNPPYGRGIGPWVAKLVESQQRGDVEEGIALLPARVDTQWIRPLDAYAKIEVIGRLKFGGDGGGNSAPFPSSIHYVGSPANLRGFVRAFHAFGPLWVPGGWLDNGY